MKKTLNGKNGGFTLIETVIALFILAIGLLGVVKLQMTSSLGNVTARNVTAATNLARNQLEQFRLVRAYCVTATVGGTTVTTPDLLDPELGAQNDLGDWVNPDHTDGSTLDENGNPGGIFSRAWNVVDDMPNPNIKTVRVRVSWDDRSGSKSVDLEMQVARKNLDYY